MKTMTNILYMMELKRTLRRFYKKVQHCNYSQTLPHVWFACNNKSSQLLLKNLFHVFYFKLEAISTAKSWAGGRLWGSAVVTMWPGDTDITLIQLRSQLFNHHHQVCILTMNFEFSLNHRSKILLSFLIQNIILNRKHKNFIKSDI